jgi:hypothetical protein
MNEAQLDGAYAPLVPGSVTGIGLRAAGLAAKRGFMTQFWQKRDQPGHGAK